MQHISILPVNLYCYDRVCCQLIVHICAIDLAWCSSASHIYRYLMVNSREEADVLVIIDSGAAPNRLKQMNEGAEKDQF